jgi:hypothetical protein
VARDVASQPRRGSVPFGEMNGISEQDSSELLHFA